MSLGLAESPFPPPMKPHSDRSFVFSYHKGVGPFRSPTGKGVQSCGRHFRTCSTNPQCIPHLHSFSPGAGLVFAPLSPPTLLHRGRRRVLNNLNRPELLVRHHGPHFVRAFCFFLSATLCFFATGDAFLFFTSRLRSVLVPRPPLPYYT